jgi:hypothetical protein
VVDTTPGEVEVREAGEGMLPRARVLVVRVVQVSPTPSLGPQSPMQPGVEVVVNTVLEVLLELLEEVLVDT